MDEAVGGHATSCLTQDLHAIWEAKGSICMSQSVVTKATLFVRRYLPLRWRAWVAVSSLHFSAGHMGDRGNFFLLRQWTRQKRLLYR